MANPGHDSSAHGGHDSAEHHGGSFKLYWMVAGVLLLATIIEVLLAEQLESMGFTGGILAGTMMTIALFKAALVILFYMHLKYERRILWWIFGIPFFLVSFLALTLFAQP